ncbi:putative disease resistance RPP13-like protein 3 [Acorus calamus]|uniref:Disease resistance RPP13-like protein 3 n=1 Tax=Acorus calamus TaxID=4465 RepID=A0AAV9D914_ACOCL|nr:putative disease resistance RPP13-like protein 3 [Acorus calamus]
MEIVRKCDGLPLAIKVIGGVLNRRRINAWEWRNVLSSNFLRLSEDGTSKIMSVLLLSYMDLPSYLKPCFLFCSLFPEDYQIYRTDAIGMWMAEGLVKEQEGDARQMEDLAELYYDELVMLSLLQVEFQDPDPGCTNTYRCKMHDIVRELAISMTCGENIIGHDGQQQGGSMKARRLSILRVEELEQIPERVKNQKYCSLRSLLVFQSQKAQNMEVIPPGLYDKLKCLRVLDLQGASFKCLPDSIGELVHLRYLNLSWSEIVQLPDSICNLRHLQTLRGFNISEIPEGFSQLQKLRHLEFNGHVEIHGGIGKLTDLQTLSVPYSRCNIEGLNCLSQLRYLAVHDLGKVPGPTEAREAAIANKTHLRSLKLRGTCTNEISGEQEIGRMKEILKEFRPNESLESLWIEDFDGQE